MPIKILKLDYIIDVFGAFMIVLAVFVFNYALEVYFYKLGFFGQAKLLPIYQITLYYVFIAFILLVSLTRLCIIFKKKGLRVFFLRICLLLISLCAAIGGEIFRTPGYVYVCRGFSERIHGEADIPAMQDWLDTIDFKSLKFYDNITLLNESEWPDSVVKLSPKDVYIEKYDITKIRVRLLWGGALPGHWGLVVGSKTMIMSNSNEKVDDEYIMQFAPGAYIWHDR